MEVKVETKENEIMAAPKLLHYLDVRGKIVIGDTTHTQRSLSIEVVTAGGEYVRITWSGPIWNRPSNWNGASRTPRPESSRPKLITV